MFWRTKVKLCWILRDEDGNKGSPRRRRPSNMRRGVDCVETSRTLQRLIANPDGADVDLSPVRLPAGALMFPAAPSAEEGFSFRTPRNHAISARRSHAALGVLGFGKPVSMTFGATALLDAGIPVHTVAQRIGDDPAVLLRNLREAESLDAGRQQSVGGHQFSGCWLVAALKVSKLVSNHDLFAAVLDLGARKCLMLPIRKGGRVV